MGPIIAYAWENTLISYKWYKELIGKRRHEYYRKRIFSNNVNNLRIVGINCSAPKERKLIETKAKWMVSEIHIHPTCFWVCFYLFIYFFNVLLLHGYYHPQQIATLFSFLYFTHLAKLFCTVNFGICTFTIAGPILLGCTQNETAFDEGFSIKWVVKHVKNVRKLLDSFEKQ